MRETSGFTLIELLVVVVIIGILATIAIPRFESTREKAYVSSMKMDLKNLGAQQEAYFSRNFVYASTAADADHESSEGVVLGGITANATGWSASASHPGTSQTCSVFYGDAAPVAPATTAGVVTCG